MALGPFAVAQTTTRVNVDSSGAQANNVSQNPSISADGRFVAFTSFATNLVPGDTNGFADIFVRDRQGGTTERVSVDSNGGQANSSSDMPSLSADGRFVAFMSYSANLVPGDTNGTWDVFVHDRATGLTERASVDSNGAQANASSQNPSISADGRFVVFMSYASNLVPGDTNAFLDVFVRDRQTGTTERVSVDSSGAQGDSDSGLIYLSVSADGRFVAFDSHATNLVSGDTNGTWDVFVRDRQLGTTLRASLDSAGLQGNDISSGSSISADGRFVAFGSNASNLVPGDTNTVLDVFVRDLQSGTTERVSVDSSGAEGDSESGFAGLSISADGQRVAFTSFATNLVPGDINGIWDVFVHDRATGLTERVSVDSSGVGGNGYSGGESLSISADGRIVTFSSTATNLVAGDTNGTTDIFVRDRGCAGGISSYCVAKLNSLGCLPSVGSAGVPSLGGPDNFYVTASNVRNQKFGMMLWSLASDSRPFFGGTLCLHTPIKRTPGQNSGGSATGNDCTGTYSYHFTQSYMLQQLLGANTTVYAQFWSRDPGFAPPNNIGLTNALQFTICP
jgi:Tol biopolymer transport system component